MSRTLNEVLERQITTAVKISSNICVYSNSQAIFVVPGEIQTITGALITVLLNKKLITYDNHGRVVSIVPT